MPIDVWGDALLRAWASWSRTGVVRTRVVSAIWAQYRSGHRSSSRAIVPILDDSLGDRVERAVRQLPPEVKNTVVEYYLKSGTIDQKAKACGVGRSEFYRRVAKATKHVAEFN